MWTEPVSYRTAPASECGGAFAPNETPALCAAYRAVETFLVANAASRAARPGTAIAKQREAARRKAARGVMGYRNTKLLGRCARMMRGAGCDCPAVDVSALWAWMRGLPQIKQQEKYHDA